MKQENEEGKGKEGNEGWDGMGWRNGALVCSSSGQV